MKKYGLQLRVPASQQRKQSSKPPLHPPPIFSDDDDEDINGEIARQATKKKVLRDVEEQHKKALAEDPTVFDYDGNYDQMKEETARPLMQDRQEKVSKYIHTLMAEAKAREQAHELVYERKLAKERSKDDHLYEGKGKFVTSAYKKKLAEQAKWLEEERIREEKDDVASKKSHDMSDFYLNLGKNVAFGGADSSAAVKKEVKGIADTSEIRDVSPVNKPPSSSSGASETNVDTSEGKVVPTGHSLQVSNVEPNKPMAGQSDQDPHGKREAALSAAKERFLARKKAKQQ
ncbi:hypothetical protein MKW94_028137 [Papaver nudicaule]|uniref:Nuclear speckle splicing regulatory protein 1 N-terminal domain-containing protein n=1 Tax=Papaver nudicaule TaxID=74823 RepID=A0AA42AQJ2_PAPNU|nr:hypothetical protein [Papaver nudicaule]